MPRQEPQNRAKQNRSAEASLPWKAEQTIAARYGKTVRCVSLPSGP
jgi:hypothetical protein